MTNDFAAFADGTHVGIDVWDNFDVMTDAAWEAWDVFVKTLIDLGITVTTGDNVRLAANTWER